MPLFTVALALVHLLRREQLREALQGFIHAVLAPGIQEDSLAYLDRYIESASLRAAGGVGFVVLLVSAGSLLRNIDSSLNDIWNVRQARPWYVRLATYLIVLVVGPPFAAISLTGTALISSRLASAHVPFLSALYEAGWWAASIAAFTALYGVAPRARVQFRSALAGGVVAGGAWEVARSIYSTYAASAFHYNPIYGTLGALPLFLIWVYVSWMLVLFGARLAYAVQHAQFRGGVTELGAHPRARELVAARIAQLAARAQAGVEPAQNAEQLSSRLHVPEATVGEILELLTGASLVRLNAAGGVLPARAPEGLTLEDISEAVGGLRSQRPVTHSAKTSEFREVEPYFASGDEAVRARLQAVSWASLVPKVRNPEPF